MAGAALNLQFLRLRDNGIPALHFSLILILVTSLFFSRFLLTVSILSLTGLSLIGIILDGRNQVFRSIFFILPALIAIWYGVSVFYSENVTAALVSLKVKGLFLALPFTFLALKNINSSQVRNVYHLFLLLCITTAAWSLGKTAVSDLNLSDIYSRGGVMPTVIHHVRYSLFVSFGAILSWWLAFRKKEDNKIPAWAYLITASFLTVYLHLLAVRSGLVGFYAASILFVILGFANGKRLGLKLSGLAVSALAIFLAFQTIPTLRSKLAYTVYSLERFRAGEEDIGIYSDSRRLLSYEAAFSLIRQFPYAGAGIGDIRDRINAYYAEKYPEVDATHLQPHNQYLFTAAALGIPAALFLLFFNLLLLLRHAKYRLWLLVAFNLILIFSFLVEDTLEMQLGTCFYFLFNYLGWATLKSETS